MEFVKLDIEGVILIKPKLFGDERGFFMESYHKQRFQENGIACEFVQDNHSKSLKGVLRGLHFQQPNPQAKLLRCLRGAILDVFVDIRPGSPTFGQHGSVELSDANKWMIFVPVGMAHGFSVLSDEAEIAYKCSDFYAPENEHGIAWSDPSLDIDWRLNASPTMNARDRDYPNLEDCDPAILAPFIWSPS